ncbi:MAG: HsdM family class I SAM-dependent methyltransferase [Nitrososphaeraceae archaeon]
MAIKKLEFPKKELELILIDKVKVEIPKGKENNVDFEVREAYLKHINDKEIVRFNETGIEEIDKNIESVNGIAKGELDVLLFNLFDDSNINLIIENKKVGSKQDALEQAKMYANSLNRSGKVKCRLIVGHVPVVKVRVLVENEWKPLIINGNEVDYFIGKNLIKLIYDNPDENEFKLSEYIEKPFTQKDLHAVVNKLKTLYRQIPEIQNNDELSINFTVSFIALKMILEKDKKKWETLTKPSEILASVDNIIGKRADKDLKHKYFDIFVMKNKEDVEIFNFSNTLSNIDDREYGEGVKIPQSIIMKIHNEISVIPETDLAIDLFGEVYETLASKKTKSSLGEFFTRRHIIQPLVRMFLTDKDIEDIVQQKKIVADIACGTGGFLTEAFKHIKKECDEKHPEIDTSELASEVIVGYDINHNNIGRTRINMTLAGDGFSDIKRVNTLSSKEIKKDVDFIITNIPYGKGDIALSDPNSGDDFLKTNNNKRLELNFLIKAIELLKKGGKALIIVPEGIMEAPTLSPLREYIIKQCKIDVVVSLPKFSFAPYTKWKTYVLFLEKRTKQLDTLEDRVLQGERVYSYIVDNDGYANSDKRFPTKLIASDGSFIHDEMSPYKDVHGAYNLSKIEQIYEAKENDEVQEYFNEWNEKIEGKKYGYISFKEILEKKTIKHPIVNATKINTVLWNELNDNKILSEDEFNILQGLAPLNKNGIYKKFKKSDYISNDNELVDEYAGIFEKLGYEYDAENNKWFDKNIEDVTYALTLVPEKYFRKKEIKPITFDEISTFVTKIEDELKLLFGGIIK